MTEKGQITVPAELRARLGLKPRDRVQFDLVGDELRVRPAKSKLDALLGAVEPRNRPEDWAAIREEVERSIADEVVSEG